MHPQVTMLLTEARRAELMRAAAQRRSVRRETPTQVRVRILRALTYLGLAVPSAGPPTAIVRDTDIPEMFVQGSFTRAYPLPPVDRELELCRS
jgi:hypothetical protein